MDCLEEVFGKMIRRVLSSLKTTLDLTQRERGVSIYWEGPLDTNPISLIQDKKSEAKHESGHSLQETFETLTQTLNPKRRTSNPKHQGAHSPGGKSGIKSEEVGALTSAHQLFMRISDGNPFPRRAAVQVTRAHRPVRWNKWGTESVNLCSQACWNLKDFNQWWEAC